MVDRYRLQKNQKKSLTSALCFGKIMTVDDIFSMFPRFIHPPSVLALASGDNSLHVDR